MTSEHIWIAVGLAGQVLFSARFIVQWLTSEKQKRSVIPTAFWYLSIGGSMVLLAYAIHLLDPVFILGQSGGFLIYCRNLYFIHREQKALAS